MKNFNDLSQNELVTTNGGLLTEVLAVAAILGGYAVIREMVRDQGRADAYKAYEDVSSGAGCYVNSSLI